MDIKENPVIQEIRSTSLDDLNPVTLRAFQSKDIEFIIRRHRDLYEIEYGFNSEFGDYVEEYVLKFNEYHDETREKIWIAEANGTTVGVIAIVKVDDSTAQLRWFLIEPQMRHRGLGHMLMKRAVDFCKEKNYKHILLWTVDVLEAARHLYKSYGFSLTETNKHELWGKYLSEERWDLYL